MADDIKEIDIFNKYSQNNKFKIVMIGVLIAVVIITLFYFFAKSLFKYTVKFEADGGTIMGEEIEPIELGFLHKIEEPQNVKKEGFYLDYWSKDKNLGTPFKFGTRIWNNTTLYAKWEVGYALVLNFGAGEENEDLSLKDLKMLYEDYLKPGSTDELPVVYNTNQNSKHYGEQLLWYENSECAGEPILEKSYVLTENIQLYGKWFDTEASKFTVDNGTLIRYEGYCRNIILPNTINKIKDIEPNRFIYGTSDQLNDQAGVYHSAFQNVVGNLNTIYINSEMVELGDCAFRGCYALERVEFRGNNIETIGAYAFADCDNLREFTIPEKVTKIDTYCFYGTDNLNRVIVGNNVTTIEDCAFLNSGLIEIDLPNVDYIGKLGFGGCNRLQKVIFRNYTVITTNVTDTTLTETNNNVFFGTASNGASADARLKIYVPEELLSIYKTTSNWQYYSDFFYGIE